jgi:hypothetical protein
MSAEGPLPDIFFRTRADCKQERQSFMNPMVKKSLFYTFKLPGMYLLIMIGFLLDFIIHFPFRFMLAIDSFPGGQHLDDSS